MHALRFSLCSRFAEGLGSCTHSGFATVQSPPSPLSPPPPLSQSDESSTKAASTDFPAMPPAMPAAIVFRSRASRFAFQSHRQNQAAKAIPMAQANSTFTPPPFPLAPSPPNGWPLSRERRTPCSEAPHLASAARRLQRRVSRPAGLIVHMCRRRVECDGREQPTHWPRTLV